MASQLDVFRHCRCLRLLGNIMIVVVLFMEGVIYYAVASSYIKVPHGTAHESWAVKGVMWVLLLFLTLLCFLTTWSYLKASFCDPGTVPAGWHPFSSPQEEELMRAEAIDRPLSSLGTGGRPPGRGRFCRKCQGWKPPRAHHCSVLGRCVLKMDHFCIWVVNAVGLLNHKFFMLFLFYSMLSCVVAFGMLLPEAIRVLSHPSQMSGRHATLVMLSGVLSLAFSLALLLFISLHVSMLMHNYTSIESLDYSIAQTWPHDRGIKRNLQEVFGRRRNTWWLPVLCADDKQWMMAQCLEAQMQPLVYVASAPKVTV